MAAPTYPIPAAADFRAIDETTYADDAGNPPHAGLLSQISANDRALYSHLKRVLVAEPFPVNGSPPVSAHLAGQVFGPWPVRLTPGTRRLDWKLRVNWSTASSQTRWVPYVLPFLPYAGDNRWAVTVTRTATDETVEGLTVGIPPGSVQDVTAVGFVLVGRDATTSGSTTGAISVLTRHSVKQGGTWGFAASDPPGQIMRLLDASNNPVTPWRDVIGTNGADDTAYVREWGGRNYPLVALNATQWEYRHIWRVTIHGIYCRERALTGNLEDFVT